MRGTCGTNKASITNSLLELCLSGSNGPASRSYGGMRGFSGLSRTRCRGLRTSCSSCGFIPCGCRGILDSTPFVVGALCICSLVSPGRFVSFSALTVLSGVSSSKFLLGCEIVNGSGDFEIRTLGNKGGCAGSLSASLEDTLLRVKFCCVPRGMRALVPSSAGTFGVAHSSFTGSIMSGVSSGGLVFPLVEGYGSTIIRRCVGSLSVVSVSRGVASSSVH